MSVSRILMVIISVVVNLPLIGQLDFSWAGTSSIHGTARIISTSTGINAALGNTAGIVDVKNWGLHVNAARRYNISGLDMLQLGAVVNSRYGHFGLQILQYGLSGYQEQKIGLSHARKLSENLQLGIQFNLLQLNQPSFENKQVFNAEIGLQAKISQDLFIGFCTYSPTSTPIYADTRIPSIFRVGPRVKVSEKLHVMAEIEKMINRSPILKTAIAYNWNKTFNVFLGAIPSGNEITFGFSYTFKDAFSIEGAYLYDQILGMTPSAGIKYEAQ